MQTVKSKVLLGLALLLQAGAQPTSNGPTYYTLTGTNVQSNSVQNSSLIEGQKMLPYAESFWFGLPQDYWCKAPQPGEGTKFTCNSNSYQPLYTVADELELASYYVTNRIVKAESGQIAYAYASANGGWTVTSGGLLSYQGSEQFYACPEQRGGAPTAYQVWHNSFDPSEQSSCVKMQIKADVVGSVDQSNLPYGYGG